MKRRTVKIRFLLTRKILLLFVCLNLTYALTTYSNISDNISKSIDIDFSAVCTPHEEIIGVTQANITFIFDSYQNQGPTGNAFMKVNEDFEDYDSVENRWDFPEKNWFTSVFEGPHIEVRKYCQDTLQANHLHFSYTPNPNIKIGLSYKSGTSNKEMDITGGTPTASLELRPLEHTYDNVFAVGRNSRSPYWLQFSIPVPLSSSKINTTIHYNFL